MWISKNFQRITIPEIKTHPWFLKNLPIELTDEYQAALQAADTNTPAQSIEEVIAIIQEAKKPGAGDTRRPGADLFVGGGSMDLDEIDDAELDDIETSGDYVGQHEYF